MVLMFITLPSSLLLTIELFFGHYIDYVNIAGLSPMGYNRPDHLLQDTVYTVFQNACGRITGITEYHGEIITKCRIIA